MLVDGWLIANSIACRHAVPGWPAWLSPLQSVVTCVGAQCLLCMSGRCSCAWLQGCLPAAFIITVVVCVIKLVYIHPLPLAVQAGFGIFRWCVT
jgi:hypothetical protein